VAHRGAVVAHWLGSSGGSLVATPDCKTAVLGSNPAISPTYSGLLSRDGLPSGMALRCRLSSEGRQRKILTIGTSVPPKTIKEKKKGIKVVLRQHANRQDKGNPGSKAKGLKVVSSVTRKSPRLKSLATENGSQRSARKEGQRGWKENGIAIETNKGNWNKDL
jgi:hypothetical protein